MRQSCLKPTPALIPPGWMKRAEDAERKRVESKRERAFQQQERAKIVQLPLWREDRRAMPNEYARSAIFTIRNKREPRTSFMNQPIFVVGEGEITYTGIELRAYDDELVWLQILNMAKETPLGKWIEFTPYKVCQAIDWPLNSEYYNKLHNCLLRLKATAVALSNKRLGKGKAISFIQEYEWEDNTGKKLPKRRVMIHPDMAELFAGNKFTEVEWRAYLKLKPLARRLYDYAASHRKPNALLLETVKKMCASDQGKLAEKRNEKNRDRKWTEQVNEALDQLGRSGLVQGEVRLGKVFFNRETGEAD